ncbi:MAG: class I SAM-dependent methyltransferase [Acidobacteriota bacterium]
MSSSRPCFACAQGRFSALPRLERAMRSDGQILDRPLSKERCGDCGLVRHEHPIGRQSVDALYGEDYRLPSLAAAEDEARAAVYFEVIRSALNAEALPRTALDVGSGSGSLARRIGRDLVTDRVVGIDPAGPQEVQGNVTLLRGGLEEHQGRLDRFDLIVSINTLEHVAEPVSALRQMEDLLTDEGTLVLVCPSASPPNVELLFFDHLWSFTSEALIAVATAGELTLRSAEPLPVSVGQFQRVVLDRGKRKTTEAPLAGRPGKPVDSKTDAYLESWQELDRNLLSRCASDQLEIFGAGQMAALLRCYAPGVWSRCVGLLMDEPEESWGLGQVERLPTSLSPDLPIVVGTHPRHHLAVAERVRALGGRAVRFDDLIER